MSQSSETVFVHSIQTGESGIPVFGKPDAYKNVHSSQTKEVVIPIKDDADVVETQEKLTYMNLNGNSQCVLI
ncbi:hypothetical protein QKU48_gp0632 [Fadolivirus algeromassiliense]|jgi:hypothetical protein|uniref:Uncharacterized protein n=1 Tax=Fadolivirus FV1/VV64 TaxID=3070911 RepID=A0A7D3UT58_9VIRU|nr:hypothetical protein QKU48_gp0632 [Fadolivirus algeromassiliense]QKF94090.1 hypothetical protein Fadolivirus_1_632 [Fadolivirus FV1/VV64]